MFNFNVTMVTIMTAMVTIMTIIMIIIVIIIVIVTMNQWYQQVTQINKPSIGTSLSNSTTNSSRKEGVQEKHISNETMTITSDETTPTKNTDSTKAFKFTRKRQI